MENFLAIVSMVCFFASIVLGLMGIYNLFKRRFPKAWKILGAAVVCFVICGIGMSYHEEIRLSKMTPEEIAAEKAHKAEKRAKELAEEQAKSAKEQAKKDAKKKERAEKQAQEEMKRLEELAEVSHKKQRATEAERIKANTIKEAERIKANTINLGDSEEKVIRLKGYPANVIKHTNQYGVNKDLHYFRNGYDFTGGFIMYSFYNGKLVSITE